MWTSYRPTYVLILSISCSSYESDTAEAVDQPEDSFDVVAQLAVMLSGEFDSSDQAAEASSYYNVHLWGCEAEAPDLDGVALYIEQALSTDQNNPYRQRLYLLTELEASEDGDARAQSIIYRFTSPAALIGTCAEGELPSFELDELELREGCEVELTWNGTSFVGGTTGQECSSSMGGDYSVSDIEIFDDRIESWDRGYYDSGIQAWGSTDGPYIFERVDH